MRNKKNFFKKLNDANKIINSTKSASQIAKDKTLEEYKSISEMQAFVDKSEEKRNLLLEVIETAVDEITGKRIIEKGVVLYVRLLEVIKLIEGDFIKNNIDFKTVQGSVTANKRIKIVNWFNDDPTNKVLLISDAGGESLDVRATPEIILYNVPQGIKAFAQTIGRVCRGNFEFTNIRIIKISDSIDCYMSELISSRRELQMELLHSDSIPVGQVNSFNKDLLNAVKKKLLWKN